MKHSLTGISICTALILIVGGGDVLAGDNLYKRMKKFFDENFVGEGFLPAPYGADDRFSPRTMWILTENAQKKAWKTGKTKAWVAFSDGRTVYSDDLAPVRRRQISTQAWNIDKETRLALAASLSGKLASEEAELGFNVARTKDLEVEITFESAEVEYVFYYDMLLAQGMNAANLRIMKQILSERYGSDIPGRRVILAALRVKVGSVSIRSKTGLDLGLEASGSLGEALGSLGFSYYKDGKAFKTLTFDDWSYIGYQALMADQSTGKISTSAPEIMQSDFASPAENWAEFVMGPAPGPQQ